jgi:class 3 adenylate cyclase
VTTSPAERHGSVPSGVVTFLFTDVENSTELWAADQSAMSASLQVHDQILGTHIETAICGCRKSGRGF